MKIRVWYTKMIRKVQSLVHGVRAKVFRRASGVPSAKTVSFAERVLLGRYFVLEVYVPMLRDGLIGSDTVYVSDPMLHQLREWVKDVRIAHEANNLEFHAREDEVVLSGWDSVTGLKGRVVPVDVYGSFVERKDIIQAISDVSVELHEAVLVTEETESAEVRKMRAVKKLGELLRERSDRYGNVRHDFDVKL